MRGEVPESWEERPLGKLGKFVKSKGGPKKDESDDGLPVVRYGELYTRHNDVIRGFHSFVPREVAEKKYTRLRVGDVLFAGSGETLDEIGKSAVFLGPEPAYGSGDIILFRPGPALDPLFVGYASNGPDAVEHKKRKGQGSSVMHIYTHHVEKLKLLVPPLPEQKKIAAILSSVDEAIQATQAVIEQTRRVKEGLLQDLLTRGIGHTRFKQTQIGQIPEGWSVRRLESVLLDGPRNGMYKPADQIGSGSLIVGQTAFTRDRMVDFSQTRRAEATDDEVKTYGLDAGDILVTRVYATPEGCGRPAYVGVVPEVAVYESNMMRLRPEPSVVEPFFLFLWLQKPLLRRYLMARASSSNQTSINQKTLGGVPIAVPPRPEQQQVVVAVRSALECVWRAEGHLQSLNATKAGLLQDLLTGKVRVSV